MSVDRAADVQEAEEGGGWASGTGSRTEGRVVPHSSPAESERGDGGRGSSPRGAGGSGDGDNDVGAAAEAPLLELAGPSPRGAAAARDGGVERAGGGYVSGGDGYAGSPQSRGIAGGGGGAASPPARGGISASEGFGDVSFEEGASVDSPGERERVRRGRRSRR